MGEKSQEKREDMVDDARQGWPSTWHTDENIERVHKLVLSNHLRWSLKNLMLV